MTKGKTERVTVGLLLKSSVLKKIRLYAYQEDKAKSKVISELIEDGIRFRKEQT